MINRFRKLGLLFVLILVGGLSAVWALSPLITTASAGDTDEDGTSIATSSPQPTEAIVKFVNNRNIYEKQNRR